MVVWYWDGTQKRFITVEMVSPRCLKFLGMCALSSPPGGLLQDIHANKSRGLILVCIVANILGSSHHHKKGWFDGNFLGRKKIMPFPAAKVSHECQIWHLSYKVIAWKLYHYSYFFRGNRDQTETSTLGEGSETFLLNNQAAEQYNIHI